MQRNEEARRLAQAICTTLRSWAHNRRARPGEINSGAVEGGRRQAYLIATHVLRNTDTAAELRVAMTQIQRLHEGARISRDALRDAHDPLHVVATGVYQGFGDALELYAIESTLQNPVPVPA